MPNQRAENQSLVAFALDRDLLRAMDAQRARLGLGRSAYLRLALVEDLQRAGHKVDRALAIAPDRAGRPHAVKTRYPAHQPSARALNDKKP